MGTEIEVGWLDIAPLGPTRKTWKMMSTLLEKGLTIHAIKSIGEVDLHKHRGWIVEVSTTPLPGSSQANFCSQWLSYPYLLWKEESAGLLIHIAEALCSEPSPYFSHSYWADTVVFFGEGCQVTPS